MTSEFEKIDNEKISNIKFDENFNKKDYFNDIEDSFQSIENSNQINLEIEKYELVNSSKDIIFDLNNEKIQSINSDKIQSINSDQSFFDSRLTRMTFLLVVLKIVKFFLQCSLFLILILSPITIVNSLKKLIFQHVDRRSSD